MKCNFLLVLIMLNSLCYGQEAFEQVLKKFQEDQHDLELALVSADSLEALAQAEGDPMLMVRTEYARGYIYRNHDRFVDALKHYQEALRLARKHKFRAREAMILNGLGMTYNLLGYYPEALRHLFRSLKLREELDQDDKSQSVVLNNIGVVYYNIGDYARSGKYFQSSFRKDSTQEFKKVNLGLVAMELGKGKQAKNFFHSFEASSPDTLSNLFQEYLIGLGLYYKKKEQYDSAIHYFSRAVDIGSQKEMDYQHAVSLYNMAASYYDRGDNTQALAYARRSDQLARKLKTNKMELQNTILLTRVNARMHNYDSAIHYFMRQDSLEDALDAARVYGEVYDMEIDEMESGYLETIRQKEALLASQKRTNALILCIALIVTLFGIVVYRNKRIKDRMYRQLAFAQDQLVEREKMAVLGRMMAGVAHELNTPLGGLRGLLHQLYRRLEVVSGHVGRSAVHQTHFAFFNELKEGHLTAPGSNAEQRRMRRRLQASYPWLSSDLTEFLAEHGVDKLPEDITDWLQTREGQEHLDLFYQIHRIAKNSSYMDQAVSRMSTVVNAMHSYMRPGDPSVTREEVDLQENMEMVLVLLENYLKRGVQVIKDFPDEQLFVQGDRDRLAQVWTNLIMNAMQAMDYEGEVRLTINSTDHEVRVSVKDNGPGIPKEVAKHIFDAFYTTRHADSGTGLGLSIVRSIVEQHHGRITFTSEPGETEFIVTFPVTNSVI